MAVARKNTAAHGREKNELQQTIDSLKADLTRATRRFGGRSPLTPNGLEQGDAFTTPSHDVDHSDIFTGGASTRRRNKLDVSGVFAIDEFGELLDRDDSPEPSPIKGAFPASNQPSSEIEALQKRLAHAQRQINTLKGTLAKEKQMRLELRNKIDAPAVRSDDEEDGNEQDARLGNRRLTPFRVGGHGRGISSGNRGMTLMQRLGMATSSPVASYADYGDEDINGEEIPPAPHAPSRLHQHDEDDEVAEFFGPKVLQPSEEVRGREPEQSQSNRTSVASIEGMDPQFANVLKRVPSNGSSYGSPLRQSVLNRSARGRGASMSLRKSRGGVPFKDGARPPSLVNAPDILAAELSGLVGTEGTPLKGLNIPEEDEFRELRKELVEFGCQTEEVLETPEPKSIAAELGIQVDSEPVPEQPKVELVEMSTQTDPEPTPLVIERSEFGAQWSFVEPLPAKPVLLDVAVETETVAEPIKSQAEIQTFESSYAQRRTTITASDLYSRSTNTSSSSDATVTRQFLAIPDVDRFEDELDEGDETETGAETEAEGETDGDNYYDARQSISMSTPATESRDDFHSVMTVTDDGYSDGSDDSEDDTESIKVSQLNSTANLLDTASSSVSEKSFSDAVVMAEEIPKAYSTVSVSADLYVEKEPEKVYIVPPKPESKEMSIQTDDWLPPLPPTSANSISPSSSLFRSAQHQFQFIPPPPPSATPSGHSGSIPNGSSLQMPPTVSLVRTRSSPADRRQSIESAISSINAVASALNRDEARVRVQSTATTLGIVDKSRPPIMNLPPPPRAPPPPNSMPPPSFLPERKSQSTAGRDAPPPRPSSPPPPELIRAATPVGGVYGPKSNLALRSHGSSVPPSQTGLKQPPSTSSFRSTGYAQLHHANGLSAHSVRERSNTSSVVSPRSSVSSERDLAMFEQPRAPRSEPPTTPNKSADITPRAHHLPNGQATDPTVIHSITQTMIGEFLYKYTRRTIGKGHGERRHRRFFWVHPYTKTLYWSSADPGSSNVTESMAKSGKS